MEKIHAAGAAALARPALVCNEPVNGDRLLALLLELHAPVAGSDNETADHACPARSADFRTMGLEPVGRIALDHELVRPHLSKWRINTAIEFG